MEKMTTPLWIIQRKEDKKPITKPAKLGVIQELLDRLGDNNKYEMAQVRNDEGK